MKQEIRTSTDICIFLSVVKMIDLGQWRVTIGLWNCSCCSQIRRHHNQERYIPNVRITKKSVCFEDCPDPPCDDKGLCLQSKKYVCLFIDWHILVELQNVFKLLYTILQQNQELLNQLLLFNTRAVKADESEFATPSLLSEQFCQLFQTCISEQNLNNAAQLEEFCQLFQTHISRQTGISRKSGASQVVLKRSQCQEQLMTQNCSFDNKSETVICRWNITICLQNNKDAKSTHLLICILILALIVSLSDLAGIK